MGWLFSQATQYCRVVRRYVSTEAMVAGDVSMYALKPGNRRAIVALGVEESEYRTVRLQAEVRCMRTFGKVRMRLVLLAAEGAMGCLVSGRYAT